MSAPIAKLQAMTDQQLIAGHDEVALHTVVGVAYYLDELRRRDQARSERKIVLLTWVIAAATVVNLLIFTVRG